MEEQINKIFEETMLDKFYKIAWSCRVINAKMLERNSFNLHVF